MSPLNHVTLGAVNQWIGDMTLIGEEPLWLLTFPLLGQGLILGWRLPVLGGLGTVEHAERREGKLSVICFYA